MSFEFNSCLALLSQGKAVSPRSDTDVSMRAVQKALHALGHDVSRAPCEWMALNAGETRQLLEASARGRCFLPPQHQ